MWPKHAMDVLWAACEKRERKGEEKEKQVYIRMLIVEESSLAWMRSRQVPAMAPSLSVPPW